MTTSSINMSQATLIERSDITDDLMVVKMRPDDGSFSFKPGQYCTLGLDGIERAYSIASAPHEGFLELFVELVPDGALTPKMWALNIGDTMTLRPRAKGIFTMNTKVHHHVMLGTVTGIVPYVSILRSHLHEGGNGHRFYVFLGASYEDELTYDSELHHMSIEHPDTIFFIPTVSRPLEERNIKWNGSTGRVNAIYESYMAGLDLPQDDTLIYTCGHPGMIEDVRQKAVPAGWLFTEERFWKE